VAAEEPAKYQQIAGELRARIRSGEFEPGARLPSKTALMEKHHVALGTVNDALKVLRDEGLLYTERGRGTFVSDPLPEEAQSELEAVLNRIDELAGEVRLLNERMDVVEREVQDHARLLARMRQRLEKAGITLANADQRDEQAM
jgi:GntR family transcriptional regulator